MYINVSCVSLFLCFAAAWMKASNKAPTCSSDQRQYTNKPYCRKSGKKDKACL